jgi:hypothetical protein
MEHSYTILINRFFTGATGSTQLTLPQSNLQYADKYYTNYSNSNIKLVDSSNVRSFIANENNKKIVQLYYSFLSSSSIMNAALIANPNSEEFVPTAEFKAIYYDDERLSDSFNNFYNSSIDRGLDPSLSYNTIIRNQLLPGTNFTMVPQNICNNYFFWQNANSTNQAHSNLKQPFSNAVLDIYGGDRNNTEEERLVETPANSESYFISVFLNRKHTQNARMVFDICDNIIYKTTDSPIVFSQTQADLVNFNEFLSSNKKVAFKKNLNNTIINQASISVKDFSLFTGTSISSPLLSSFNLQEEISNEQIVEQPSTSSKFLIQCFVDPNFQNNENEFWSNNRQID